MVQGRLDEEEEDAGDAQRETPANTNANTSKTRQVEGDDTDEPEAETVGGVDVYLPVLMRTGCLHPIPHITGPKKLGPPWRKRWHACDNNILQG